MAVNKLNFSVMLTKIKAKYTSRCAETGKQILVNEVCIYDKSAKKVYKLGTKKEQQYNEEQATGKLEAINARFTCRCAETNERIEKGELCYYDRQNKVVYCLRSDRAKSQIQPITDRQPMNEDRRQAATIRPSFQKKPNKEGKIPARVKRQQPILDDAKSLFDAFFSDDELRTELN